MPPVRSRHRAWCFTVHCDANTDIPFEYTERMKYLVYQKERAPSTGALHFQGYVVMVNPTSLVGMKAIHATAHFEVANGSAEDNIRYCTKEDTRVSPPVERGERPRQGTTSSSPPLLVDGEWIYSSPFLEWPF